MPCNCYLGLALLPSGGDHLQRMTLQRQQNYRQNNNTQRDTHTHTHTHTQQKEMNKNCVYTFLIKFTILPFESIIKTKKLLLSWVAQRVKWTAENGKVTSARLHKRLQFQME